MNYYFNILWFEDSTSWFRGAKRRTEGFVESHCLDCCIDRKRTSEFVIDDLTNNKYDLILIDYDLKSDHNGDSVIKNIRESEVYTDILFYSSEYDSMLDSIRSLSPPLDGIYYSNRKFEEFNNKLKNVINKIVCRSEDLINLRGFVMDNASDFEVRFKEILNVCWQKFTDKQKLKLTTELDKVFSNKIKFPESAIKKAKGQADVFAYSNNEKRLLSSGDRLDLLGCVIDILNDSYSFNFKLSGGFKSYYNMNISQYRNQLGHAKMGDEFINVGGKDIPIDQELHRLMRVNIKECEKHIAKIECFVTESI